MATQEPQQAPPQEEEAGSPGTWDLELSEIQEDAVPEDDDSARSSGQSVYDAESVKGESGRTYHGYKQGKYYLPNDSAEQDRLDIMHVSFRLLLDGKLAMAPFTETPRYVLDIGTGTGIWAIQFEEHPTSFVIGTDLSAIQPPLTIANCAFHKDDAEEELWVFPELSDSLRRGSSSSSSGTTTPAAGADAPPLFDYIHLRFMVTCFDRPLLVMQNAFRHLSPGGWVEFQDSIMPVMDFFGNEKGTAVERWNKYMSIGGAAHKRDFTKAGRYKEWLEEVGFVDVQERKLEWPMSPWPADARRKKAGWYMLRSIMHGFRGLSWAFLSAAGLGADETEALIADCKKEILSRKHGWYFGVYVVYGRKPLEGERPGETPAS